MLLLVLMMGEEGLLDQLLNVGTLVHDDSDTLPLHILHYLPLHPTPADTDVGGG